MAGLPELQRLHNCEAERLVISVVLDAPQQWMSGLPEAPADPVASVSPVDDGLRVTLHPGLVGYLDRADNQGERLLLGAVLEGLLALAEPAGVAAAEVDGILELHAPLGPKKKINLFPVRADWALTPGGLPYRPIQEAETERLLDELGVHLTYDLGMPEGPVAEDDRVRVLNAAVAFHYGQLKTEVARLSPSGLLEQLIRVHEGIVRHEALERLMIGSRIAAFGETEMIEQLRRSVPEASRVALSMRFLLEFVAARPPKGLRPLSRDGLDRLLGICAEIVTRGMTSDAIRFGLDDTHVEILGARRLGTSKDSRYHLGRETYLDVAIPTRVWGMAARYADAWERRSKEKPKELEHLENAARAEWGLTLREIVDFLSTLATLAHEAGGEVTSSPPEALTEELQRQLGWPQAEVSQALDLFTLRSRPDFTEPPPGFERKDLWPWRFNRRLSYLRRPILVRPTPSGEELVWGVRQPDQAGRFLLNLIFSERLQASSSEMKQLMTRLRQDESRQFVELVADDLRAAGMVVDTNVAKIEGNRLRRAGNQDLGDVDVLAADMRARQIYAVECKDLEGARTPAELANELRTTFGSSGKGRSGADRHVERVGWLRAHRRATLNHLGLAMDARRWRVIGMIVTDVPVMSPHVAECRLPVHTRRELSHSLDRAFATSPTSDA